MKILLTGGSGFVGSTLIRGTEAREHTIISLGRTDPNAPTNGRSGILFRRVDITNRRELEEVAETLQGEFDALVHLAAYVPRQGDEDQLQAAHDVNIQGTINLLEVFGDRVKKIIVGSTAEVYDQRVVSGVLQESAVVGPASYYGATKLGSEFIATAYGRKRDVAVTVLRFSVMYGPSDPIARALPNFIKKALVGETIEVRGGDILRDYVHVEDVVDSIYCALSATAQGIYNIGTGNGVTIETAARQVIGAAQSQSRLVVHEGQGADIVLDTHKAEVDLGFRAKVLFPDKLEEMVDSFR